MRPVLLAAAAVLAAVVPAPAVQPDGTRDLFNGKDLAGFVNVNCAPGTFVVKDGEIVTTGNPTGFLRTDRHYENFELDFDWMHVEQVKMANSGLFVWGDPLPGVGTPYTRGIEVQVLINFAPKDGWATSHGDIFSIHGARCTPDRVHPVNPKMERCLPSENRVKGGGQWNHYKVLANDGAIKLHVNGKEVSGVSKSSPRKGYLAFESEGAECHFKNVKIKELASTNPKADEVAQVWGGHVSIFTGLDLTGWKTNAGAWTVGGGILRAKADDALVSAKAYKVGELQFDWRLPAKAEGKCEVRIGRFALDAGPPAGGGWNRTVVDTSGRTLKVTTNGRQVSLALTEAAAGGEIGFTPAVGLEVMNVFVKEAKGD